MLITWEAGFPEMAITCKRIQNILPCCIILPVGFLFKMFFSEEGMATHSSTLAWRIPIDRGAWQATVHGVTESDLIDRSSTQKVE